MVNAFLTGLVAVASFAALNAKLWVNNACAFVVHTPVPIPRAIRLDTTLGMFVDAYITLRTAGHTSRASVALVNGINRYKKWIIARVSYLTFSWDVRVCNAKRIGKVVKTTKDIFGIIWTVRWNWNRPLSTFTDCIEYAFSLEITVSACLRAVFCTAFIIFPKSGTNRRMQREITIAARQTCIKAATLMSHICRARNFWDATFDFRASKPITFWSCHSKFTGGFGCVNTVPTDPIHGARGPWNATFPP